ncbi:MAG: hypothetical protein ABI647_16495 [Gemmatimonadota bacterium]
MRYAFLPGHRIGIEQRLSLFRASLNTGGNNFDEEKGVVAHNVIHHGPKHPSVLVLPVRSTREQ